MQKMSPINTRVELDAVLDLIYTKELIQDSNALREFVMSNEFSNFEKGLIYSHIDMTDWARTAFEVSRDEGNSFFQKLIPFLNSQIIPLAFSVDVFEYINLKNTKEEVLNQVAANYIAPRLMVSAEDKMALVKNLAKVSKVEGVVSNGQISFTSIQVELLWKELNIGQVLVNDERVKAAMEYSQDVELELAFKHDQPEWIIKPALTMAWDKVKSNIQESLEFLAANTILNPNFRKVATVCIVVGAALYSEDSMAGDNVFDAIDHYSGMVDERLKGAMTANDASCDINQFSSKLIKQNLSEYEFVNRIGDYQVTYEVKGYGVANIHASKPVITKVSDTGCGGYTLADIHDMVGSISKGLIRRTTGLIK